MQWVWISSLSSYDWIAFVAFHDTMIGPTFVSNGMDFWQTTLERMSFPMKTALPTTTARERPRLNDIFSKFLSRCFAIGTSMLRRKGLTEMKIFQCWLIFTNPLEVQQQLKLISWLLLLRSYSLVTSAPRRLFFFFSEGIFHFFETLPLVNSCTASFDLTLHSTSIRCTRQLTQPLAYDTASRVVSCVNCCITWFLRIS